MSTISRRGMIQTAAAVPVIGSCIYTMSNVGPLQCGFVGLGRRGKKLIESINPNYIRIHGVYDSITRTTQSGNEWFFHWTRIKRSHYYQRFEDMLNDSGIEAVVIATPLMLHGELAIQALKAGKHVFIERMMAATPDECRQMVELAAKNNLILQVGHLQFFSPVFWDAFQVIQAGVLGSVYHCRIVTKNAFNYDEGLDVQVWSLGERLQQWQLNPGQSYGFWSETVCDWLGWVQGLFPKHKPIAVQAHTNRIQPKPLIKIDTNLFAIMEYDYNFTVSVSCLNGWERFDLIGQDYLQIMGTHGTLIISYNQSKDLYEMQFQYEHVNSHAYDIIVDFIEEHPDTSVYYLSGYHGNHRKNPPVTSSLKPFMTEMQLKGFAHAIRANQPCFCDGVLGMQIANTCYAGQQAAQTHERIHIQL